MSTSIIEITNQMEKKKRFSLPQNEAVLSEPQQRSLTPELGAAAPTFSE